VALKQFEDKRVGKYEYRMLSKFDNPHIVRAYGYDETTGTMMMELLSSESLFDVIVRGGGFSEDLTRYYFK
jgi:serine/threonine protein kinase